MRDCELVAPVAGRVHGRDLRGLQIRLAQLPCLLPFLASLWSLRHLFGGSMGPWERLAATLICAFAVRRGGARVIAAIALWCHGPWAGPTRTTGHASWAGLARKTAHSGVPVPKARPVALSAQEAQRAMPIQPPSGRAWHKPVSCQARPAR